MLKVHILCVGDAVMSEPFRGQIRKEDVRAVEKDRVEMYRSFRWAKLDFCYSYFLFWGLETLRWQELSRWVTQVQAADTKHQENMTSPVEIIWTSCTQVYFSGAGYLLTTAENELGVVIARS